MKLDWLWRAAMAIPLSGAIVLAATCPRGGEPAIIVNAPRFDSYTQLARNCLIIRVVTQPRVSSEEADDSTSSGCYRVDCRAVLEDAVLSRLGLYFLPHTGLKGFAFTNHANYLEFVIHSWLILILTFLLAIPLFARIRREWLLRIRARKGSCLACGYNLYGLVENRCPECALQFESRVCE